VDPYKDFTDRMRELISGDRMERAKVLTKRFWSESFTGRWFHVLADHDHPNEVTARDIVAVSTLGVTVPRAVTIWLLSEEGPRRGGRASQRRP
jgi:hypothetical protein